MSDLKTSSHETPRLRYTREKIEDFARLPQGWHYGEGGPLARETADVALGLLDFITAQGFSRTNAFFGADGSMSLTIYHGDHYLELNFGAGDGIEYVEEEGEEETDYGDGLTVQEAEDRIRDFKEKVWALSGLLTSPTGIMTVASLTTGPLQAFARAVSLSLTVTALLGTAAESAPTLRDSTQACPATLPPTGLSQTEPSQAIVDTSGSLAPLATDATAT